ncbi:MAG: AzlD domain-containing protein [Propionibacteriaceae bacterium]|jgi:branched-subunit amino acid transport protein AzlD|nr:AzlD domain-containing protein [Propionibacteriaceae bacterium]
MTEWQVAIMVACAAAATVLTRAIGFWAFGKRAVPAFVSYLGDVLPAAVMAMLVVFCLRDTPIEAAPHGIPELIAIAATAALWLWRKNVLLAVLGGTALYLTLIHLVFV